MPISCKAFGFFSEPVKNKFLLVADSYQKHLYQLNMDVWDINAVALETQLLRYKCI